MHEVTYQIDLQNMSLFQDGEFDLIVCSHVLEHVCSDKQAMQEIYRVLDEKGLAVLLVPIDLDRKQTDEQWGLSQAENEKRFGQKDHVRSYSRKDFIDRLKAVGFTVFLLDESYFTYQEFRENAFLETFTLYVVCKNDRLYQKETIEAVFSGLHKSLPIEKEYLQETGVCNYWLDVCTVTEKELYLWGWIYIIGKNSRQSKLKVMLEKDTKSYIFGAELRKREDIQQIFGNDTQENCLYSGIDFKIPLDQLSGGVYDVWLLIRNGQAKYRMDLSRQIVINSNIAEYIDNNEQTV
ncbi:MAG: class I SAM-dependent methyltransferase [Eubacterium sp.]|nr:class I SAM-dependent methyltransferase [Eubacterium sp.]